MGGTGMLNDRKHIIATTDRLNGLMESQGCAAVVASSGKNFTYLSGFS